MAGRWDGMSRFSVFLAFDSSTFSLMQRSLSMEKSTFTMIKEQCRSFRLRGINIQYRSLSRHEVVLAAT